MRGIQIAIDGPAGAGKSTIARMLSEKLGFLHIDTGAMYRALTYEALKRGISCDDEGTLASLSAECDIKLVQAEGGVQLVYCNGVDITEQIRSPLVSQKVSQVSRHKGVRNIMASKQRALACGCDVVMDGRDIGTVVLPKAECKIFLTADPEERARRRYLEMVSKGYTKDFSVIRSEMEARDKLDQTRTVDPLHPASDAKVVDTTGLTPQEVVSAILDICLKKSEE